MSLPLPRRVIESQSTDFVMEHLLASHAFNLMPGRLIQRLRSEGRIRTLALEGIEDITIPMRVMAMVEHSQANRPDVIGLIRVLQRALTSRP